MPQGISGGGGHLVLWGGGGGSPIVRRMTGVKVSFRSKYSEKLKTEMGIKMLEWPAD